ncbi:unnamed protein product [Pylaiella littoralis]
MGPSSTPAVGPLLSLLAVCCAALLFREARAYSGTVPIFPDVAAGKKQEAAKAYEMQCKRRPKVFAPRAVIKANGLSKTFDTHHIFFEDEHVKALDDVTANIHGPGSVAVVGPWNSGKSTFLKCLAGLETPTHGDVTVSGLRKAVYVGRDIVSTTGKAIRHLVREEVASSLPGNVKGRDVELTTNTILEALDLHGVSLSKDRRVDLSGGEVYRFAIAMALARGCGSPTPPVLLLDDMFNKSDQRVRFGVEFNLFKLQREMGVMLVFTADDYAVVMELGRQVVEFDDGKITEVSVHEKSRYARRVFEGIRRDIDEEARRFRAQSDGSTLSSLLTFS